MRSVCLFFLIIVMGLSCSRLEFRSQNKIPHWGQKQSKPSERFEIIGERKFYLWGQYPDKHEVLIDHEIIKKGYREAYELSIEEYQTWQNFLWTVSTLGMFVPQNYAIKGKGVKGE